MSTGTFIGVKTGIATERGGSPIYIPIYGDDGSTSVKENTGCSPDGCPIGYIPVI